MGIAVVGCGYWGKNLVRTFYELKALAAICDENPVFAKELAEQYQVPIFSFAEVLADKTIEGVVIAAPAALHASLVESALLAGKHVFVEKPLALRVEEAEKLDALSQSQNKILMVGHLLQYHPAFLELKRLLEEGQLGALQYLYSNRLNLGKIRTEENVLWSFAPHDLSMILSLVGDLPEKVYATSADYLSPQIADFTTVNLSFKNGVKAHVFVSWLHPEKEQKLVLVGKKGMAVFNDRLPWKEKLQLYPSPIQFENGVPISNKVEPIFISFDVCEPLKLECQHFLECIEKGQTPRTDGKEGLRVLQVLNAAETSIQKGQEIFMGTSKNPNLVIPAQAGIHFNIADFPIISWIPAFAGMTIRQALRVFRSSLMKKEKALPYFRHETAWVDEGCVIGAGTKIWHFSHILKGTQIGQDVVVGQNVMIGPDVVVGDFCKIQNNVSLYKGVTLEEGVFCGPSCVFTNVYNPRAEVERKEEFLQTYVERGVTIGANATIVCGIRLGAYSFIGAGAVVIRDVKPHAVMVGNPARQIGWMSHSGEKLGDDLVCKREGRCYSVDKAGFLQEISDKGSVTKRIKNGSRF